MVIQDVIQDLVKLIVEIMLIMEEVNIYIGNIVGFVQEQGVVMSEIIQNVKWVVEGIGFVFFSMMDLLGVVEYILGLVSDVLQFVGVFFWCMDEFKVEIEQFLVEVEVV